MALTVKHKEIEFGVGDVVRVYQAIQEASGKKGEEIKTRLQYFEGMVIGAGGQGNGKTFTVRRIGAGKVGIEKIFPVALPTLDHVEVVSKGSVRRAKLYYLRDKSAREISEVTKRYARKQSAKVFSQKASFKKTLRQGLRLSSAERPQGKRKSSIKRTSGKKKVSAKKK